MKKNINANIVAIKHGGSVAVGAGWNDAAVYPRDENNISVMANVSEGVSVLDAVRDMAHDLAGMARAESWDNCTVFVDKGAVPDARVLDFGIPGAPVTVIEGAIEADGTEEHSPDPQKIRARAARLACEAELDKRGSGDASEDRPQISLRIEFKSERNTEAVMLGLELRGGTDMILEWDYRVNNRDPIRRTVSQLCSGLHPMGQTCRIPWDVLAHARVLYAKFESDVPVTDLRVFLVDQTRNVSVPLDSYIDRYPSGIDWALIDRGARNMVRYFNNLGLKTRSSCAGHPGTRDKRFYIEFDPGTGEDKIRQFMRSHAPLDQDYAGRGWFGSRFIQKRQPGEPDRWQPVTYFYYEAPDQLDALCDLNDWVADDMSGTPGHGAGIDIPGYEKEKQAAHMAVENMDPNTMIQLYNMIQKHRIKNDVEAWLQGEKQEPLTPEQIDRAAELYVYQGKYDLGLPHWDNIANIVELVRCGN